jgi:hypothetical protein
MHSINKNDYFIVVSDDDKEFDLKKDELKNNSLKKNLILCDSSDDDSNNKSNIASDYEISETSNNELNEVSGKVSSDESTEGSSDESDDESSDESSEGSSDESSEGSSDESSEGSSEGSSDESSEGSSEGSSDESDDESSEGSSDESSEGSSDESDDELNDKSDETLNNESNGESSKASDNEPNKNLSDFYYYNNQSEDESEDNLKKRTKSESDSELDEWNSEAMKQTRKILYNYFKTCIEKERLTEENYSFEADFLNDLNEDIYEYECEYECEYEYEYECEYEYEYECEHDSEYNYDDNHKLSFARPSSSTKDYSHSMITRTITKNDERGGKNDLSLCRKFLFINKLWNSAKYNESAKDELIDFFEPYISYLGCNLGVFNKILKDDDIALAFDIVEEIYLKEKNLEKSYEKDLEFGVEAINILINLKLKHPGFIFNYEMLQNIFCKRPKKFFSRYEELIIGFKKYDPYDLLFAGLQDGLFHEDHHLLLQLVKIADMNNLITIITILMSINKKNNFILLEKFIQWIYSSKCPFSLDSRKFNQEIWEKTKNINLTNLICGLTKYQDFQSLVAIDKFSSSLSFSDDFSLFEKFIRLYKTGRIICSPCTLFEIFLINTSYKSYSHFVLIFDQLTKITNHLQHINYYKYLAHNSQETLCENLGFYEKYTKNKIILSNGKITEKDFIESIGKFTCILCDFILAHVSEIADFTKIFLRIFDNHCYWSLLEGKKVDSFPRTLKHIVRRCHQKKLKIDSSHIFSECDPSYKKYYKKILQKN